VENWVGWNRTSFWKTTKLFENSSDGWQPVTYSDGTPVLGIRSISDQGIDNFGHAMIDVTLNDNTAYEVADGYQPALLGYGIKDAKAGQGVSYVLFNNGNMYEYTDATSSWSFLDSGVSAIDAGTDRLGVNMVAELYQGQVWTRSDSSGWQQIPYHLYSVGQISAGRQGVLGFVDAAGRAYLWSQDSGQLTYEIDGVNRITTGYDQNGGLVVDLLYSNGNVYDWRATTGRWIQLAQSTHALSKARAGVVDVLANTSDGWEIGAGFSYTYLGNAIQGVA